jgi:hypothetical protein
MMPSIMNNQRPIVFVSHCAQSFVCSHSELEWENQMALTAGKTMSAIKACVCGGLKETTE